MLPAESEVVDAAFGLELVSSAPSRARTKTDSLPHSGGEDAGKHGLTRDIYLLLKGANLNEAGKPLRRGPDNK